MQGRKAGLPVCAQGLLTLFYLVCVCVGGVLIILNESMLALQNGSVLETEVKSFRGSIPAEGDSWESKIPICLASLGKDEPWGWAARRWEAHGCRPNHDSECQPGAAAVGPTAQQVTKGPWAGMATELFIPLKD